MSYEDIARWAFDELVQVEQEFINERDHVMLKTLHEAPVRLKEGMVVKADGTNWNPGSGAGIYAYVGGAWVKL
jgi:hypothetical protein